MLTWSPPMTAVTDSLVSVEWAVPAAAFAFCRIEIETESEIRPVEAFIVLAKILALLDVSVMLTTVAAIGCVPGRF